jgi:trigger factor
MKHTITDVAPCRKRIEIEFDVAEVDKGFDEVYREISESARIKGFRPGHVPRRVLERKFGKNVNADVARHVFQKGLSDLFEQEKISPMESPEFKPDADALKPGQAFSHAVEIDVRPVFELADYTGLPLKDEIADPADQEVEDRLQRYARALAKHDPVEGPAQKEDVLKNDIRLVVPLDGEEKELVNDKNQYYRVGAGEKLLGMPCPGIDDKTVGAKIGDVLTFDVTIPEEHPDETLRGKSARATMTVIGIERPEPVALDDAFAASAGFESMDQFRDTVRESILAERARLRREAMEKQAIDLLVERNRFDIPEAYLKRRALGQFLQARMRLAREGATKELLQEKNDELEASTRAATERGIRWSAISDAIAEKEKIEITQEDVQRHVDMLAGYYKLTPAKMLKQIRDMDGMYALAAEIRDGRVLQHLLDKAVVEKAAVQA